MPQPLITIDNLSVAFPTREGLVKAVNEVSLVIPRGQTVGLVGESGCGKSVTAMAILQLIAPPGRVTGGRIILHDQGGDVELTTAPTEQIRRIRGGRIGMIIQEPMTSLNPVYTIGQQIAESLRIHKKLSSSAARARALELLNLVKIPQPEKRIDDYPHQFSGGMRQRVMIAIALACDPELLIADEPTTALDVTIQAQILDLLRELQARAGMAILLITHDLGVVAEMANSVTVMYASQVVESAAGRRVFDQPLHPYTVGLLRSRPQPGNLASLHSIPGMVPSAANLPAGCYFHPRCAWAKAERCPSEMPRLRVLTDTAEPQNSGHLTRCHYAEELLGEPSAKTL
ncbi:MAG: ABC transporter ATP-binding protein [Pirellulales bacterium]|nr:ABC transporter ATP-binding protein [Pirellulales bacterium]